MAGKPSGGVNLKPLGSLASAAAGSYSCCSAAAGSYSRGVGRRGLRRPPLCRGHESGRVSFKADWPTDRRSRPRARQTLSGRLQPGGPAGTRPAWTRLPSQPGLGSLGAGAAARQRRSRPASCCRPVLSACSFPAVSRHHRAEAGTRETRIARCPSCATPPRRHARRRQAPRRGRLPEARLRLLSRLRRRAVMKMPT